MMKTKMIAMILVIAIALGAIGIGLETGTQSAQGLGVALAAMTTPKVMTTAAAIKIQAATPKVPNH